MRENETRQRPFFMRLIDRCVVASAMVSAAMAFVLMAHIIINTTMRYVSDVQILGTIEITSNWWMVLMAFPVFALAQRNREHIDVTVVTDLMPEAHRIFCHILVRIGSMGIVLLIAYLGWLHALDMAKIEEYALGAVKIPIWPMRFVVPFGMVLFAIQLMVDLTDDLRAWKERSNGSH